MGKLRHPVAAFAILGGFFVLFASIYASLSDQYGFSPDDLDEQGNTVIQRLNNLNLLQGLQRIVNAIASLKDIKFTNIADLVGNLASAGTAILQIIAGIVLLPLELFGALTDFFTIPPIISTIMGAIIAVYIFFIILSAYLRHDI